MAVELRCPECRAKLRLKQAPEPDSEIECSQCGFVFPTDDNIVHAGGADDDERPAKKKSAANDEDDETSRKKPSSEPKKNDKPPTSEQPFKRKKRRAKKKKTNPVVLWSVIGGSLLILGFVAGVLIWVMTKQTASQEMMTYLPDDCDEAIGLNVGHMQKYPAFYKTCENLMSGKGFKKAADAFASALGTDTNTILEYVVQGEGKVGGKPEGGPVEATVLRTKTEFDTSLLSKMPGAKEYSAEGIKYYTINDIPDLNYPSPRVFAPTNRLVVFCRGDIQEAKFKAMLKGNRDNPDNIFYKRAGPLFKAVTRGTAWKITLYGRSVGKPTPPAAPANSGTGGAAGATQERDEDVLKKEIVEILGPAKGMGFKASVGSRDVRGEWVIWCKDSDAASALAKKWKEKDWVKDDEKLPPNWWKSVASKSGGGKTAENALRDGLGFRSSGETFTIRTSLETKILQDGVAQLVRSVTGDQSGPLQGMGGPQGMGGGGNGGPMAPPGGGGGSKMGGSGGGGPGGKGPPGAQGGMPGTGNPPGKRRRFPVKKNREPLPRSAR